eukprot:9708-Pyramimonas_sp.AAC.1
MLRSPRMHRRQHQGPRPSLHGATLPANAPLLDRLRQQQQGRCRGAGAGRQRIRPTRGGPPRRVDAPQISRISASSNREVV